MSSSRSAADRIGRLTGLAIREVRVVGSQHGYRHLMITLVGGRRAFAKAVAADPPDRSVVASDGVPRRAGPNRAFRVR